MNPADAGSRLSAAHGGETVSSREGLSLTQVAFIADRADVHATSRWYQRVLGLAPSGWTDKFGGPALADLQGLSDPDCKLTIAWLVGQDEAFQVELFEYQRPPSRPLPDDWTPRDIGYTLTTFFVADFDGVVDRARVESAMVTEPSGSRGGRRAVLADPSGNLLELVEKDLRISGADPPVRPEIGAAVRSVRASVLDLDRSMRFFGDGLGLKAIDIAVHDSADEALWGLAGAEPESRVLVAGNVLLELVQYRDPAGTPHPDDYQLSDGGVMNIALATTSKSYYEQTRDRIEGLGFESREFVPSEHVSVSYVTDEDAMSVELLYMTPEAYPDFGFVPEGPTGADGEGPVENGEAN